jgi:exosortase A
MLTVQSPRDHTLSSLPRKSLWGPLLLATISFAGFLFCFRETWLGMVHIWSSSRSFSHCFLIVPCALYLVWRRRHVLAGGSWQADYKALPLFIICGSLWMLGNLADAKVIEQFSFVGMSIALIYAVFGGSVVKILRFPLAFLFFAVPFGVRLIGPLQDFTAWFTVHALNLTGIPAVLENRVLSVASGSWTVSEACSGIRYLFASVVLGVFLGAVIYRSKVRRLLLAVASILTPIIANGVRAYLIVILAYVTGNRIAVGIDHVVYGAVFFVLIQTAQIALAMRWRQPPAADELPVSHATLVNAPKFASAAVVCVTVIILCCILPLQADQLRSRSSHSLTVISEPSILVSPPWQPAATHDASWNANVGQATQTFRFAYDSGRDGSVQLVYALFNGEHSATVDNSYELFSEPKLWALARDKSQVAIIDGQRVLVHESMFAGPVERTVWTWYWIDGEYTGSALGLKWRQAKARILGRPMMVVAITVGSDGPITDPTQASRTLQDFVGHTTFTAPTSLSKLIN